MTCRPSCRSRTTTLSTVGLFTHSVRRVLIESVNRPTESKRGVPRLRTPRKGVLVNARSPVEPGAAPLKPARGPPSDPGPLTTTLEEARCQPPHQRHE